MLKRQMLQVGAAVVMSDQIKDDTGIIIDLARWRIVWCLLLFSTRYSMKHSRHGDVRAFSG
jgi:hypothetical protein